MKKLKIALLVISCATLSAVFIGCNNDGNGGGEAHNKHSYSYENLQEQGHRRYTTCTEHDKISDEISAHNFSGGSICVDCGYKMPMTFDDLIKDHSTEATKFFNEHLKDTLTAGAETKAERYFLNDADGDNKVDSATMEFIYGLDDTTRAVQVSSVYFTPIECQEIADEAVTSVNITNYTTREVFSFDAKENYNNQDVASALFGAVNKTNDVNLYREIEESGSNRQFVLLNSYSDSLSTMTIKVPKGDGSKEALIKNLTRFNFTSSNESVTTLDGVCLSSSTYQLENLGSSTVTPNPGENEDPGQKNPPKEDDETKITNAEIISALEKNCMDKIINIDNPIIKRDQNKIVEKEWYFTKNSDNEVTSAEFLFKLQSSNTSAHYIVVKLQFKEALSTENINNENISNGSVVYLSTSFDTTIQTEYQDLTDAICDKLFGEAEEGTQRFIVRTGGSTDATLGSTTAFKVIEISEKEIHEASIQIKSSSSIDEYVSNFTNGLHTTSYENKKYEISGEKVTAETEKTT